MAGRPPKRSRTELSGRYLERSNYELAKSPDTGHRWAYRRIMARRIDSSGRRMAMAEWENTWEPEDELDGLVKALRRYARERW